MDKEQIKKRFDLVLASCRYDNGEFIPFILASHYSGWHETATLHGEGSMESQKMMIMAEAPVDYYKKLATELLGLKTR